MLIGILFYLCSFSIIGEESISSDSNLSAAFSTEEASDLKNLKFRNYSIQDGLSQASVLSAFQDEQGFIWLGTLEGLNRFDGYQFKTWRFEIQNEHSISHNVIYRILEDEEGYLWLATHNGLCKFNKSTEQFERFYNDGIFGRKNVVNTMIKGGEKFLWVGTEQGLLKFDKHAGTFEIVDQTTENGADLKEEVIKDLKFDTAGRLWVATKANGLFLLDIEKNRLDQFSNDANNSNTLSSNNLRSLLIDAKGRLWIATEHAGVSRFDIEKKSFSSYRHDPFVSHSLSSDEVLSLHQDSEGLIWIGTAGSGLNLFDEPNDQFISFKNNSLNDASLPDNVVRVIESDKSGNLILGHSSMGFCIADKSTQVFKHFKHSPLDMNSLSHDNVWSVIEDSKKNLWVATSNGLNRYDPTMRTNKIYRHENGNSISQNYVRCVYEDREGRIWIGTYRGLNLLNPETSKITRFYSDPDLPTSLSDNRVRSILQDSDGEVWIGTAEGGLNKFNEQKKEFRIYTNDPSDPNSISSNSVRMIVEDQNGLLWLGTDQGLNSFDKTTGKFNRYKNNPGDSNSLSNNSIQYLYLSKDNKFWICTNGGLNLFDTKTGIFKSWGLKQGLSNEIVYGLLEDKNGFLWMSTNKGINKFDPEKEAFTWYDELDGLQSNEFNAGAFTSDSKGRMYFGGVNGLSVFDPMQIEANEYVPPVVLTDFLLFNKSVPVAQESVLQAAVTSVDEIELGYQDFFFAIEFAALNYRQPEKNEYAYKLIPFNKDWIYTNYKDRKAVYTNVPSGKYEFVVKASNDDGIWNEEGATVMIRINPPWWLLWWMKLIYFVLTIFVLAQVYKYRTRRLKIQKKVLKRMVAERTLEIENKREELKKKNIELGNKNEALSNALNDLHSTQRQLIQSEKMASLGVLSSGVAHEINNPLNFIQGGISGLAREIEQIDMADKRQFNVFVEAIQEGVSRAAKIIKSLNQFSHQGGSDIEEVNINEVVENCLEILRSSIHQDVKVTKTFDDEAFIVLGSRSKCHQIIVNILSNANQSLNKDGSISIITKKNGEMITLSIEDNGCGIPEEHLKKVADPFFTTKGQGQGTGLGLYISYNLVKEMEGALEVSSELGKGTMVMISLPCAQLRHLPDDVAKI